MKKKILSLVLAICLIVPCVILLSSCKVDTFYLHVNLNGGDYTEIYKQENNYGGNNVIMVVNPKLYDRYSIPVRGDLIAPEGKVFAGWYLNEDCTPDYYFNKTNWNRIVEEKKTKERKSATIYAYWIDDEEIALSFDLEGSGLEFTQSYKIKQNINYNISRFIGTPSEIIDEFENFPTASDIIVPEDKTFNGWYINGSTEVNKETLVENLTTLSDDNADIRVYPKWDMRVEVGVIVYASIEGTQVSNYAQYSGEYYFKENTLFEVGQYYNYEHGLKVYKDEFDKVSNFLNEIVTNNIIEKSESVQNSQFDGWKIVQYGKNEINLIVFNEENWNALVEDVTSYQSVKIVATWK